MLEINSRNPKLYIAALLLITGFFFCLRSVWHEPNGDELIYMYNWEADDAPDSFFNYWERRFDNRITPEQVIDVQMRHYQFVNGRFFVHTAEQLISCTDLSMTVFYILNTFVFLAFVGLLIVYATRKNPDTRSNYLLWLLAILSLLYLFPDRDSLWPSLNMGLNYLWPATMTVAMLMVWNRMERARLSTAAFVAVLVLAFFTGWSNEAFAVGLSGGMFLYYCFHYKKFRGQIVAVCIVLWLGTALMCFAPANFARFITLHQTLDASLTRRLILTAVNFLRLKMTPVLIVLLIWLACKQRLMAFLKSNTKVLYVFASGAVFLSMANTEPRAMTLLEMLSLILTIRYLSGLKAFGHNGKRQIYVVALFTVLFMVHQTILAKDTEALYRSHHKAVEDMEAACPLEVVGLQEPELSWATKPFLSSWRHNYVRESVQQVHGGKKGVKLVSAADRMAICQPEKFFVPENKIPGDAPLYYTEDGYFIWIDRSAFSPTDTLIGVFEEVRFDGYLNSLLALRYLLSPAPTPDTVKVNTYTAHTRYGEVTYAYPHPARRLKWVFLKKAENR